MSFPIARPTDGDDAADRPLTLAGWLRERSDRDLAHLLQLRPDLALPAPADVGALALRLGVRTSTQRAVDALDARTLNALETLVLATGPDDTVEDPDVDGLDDLFDLALVWGPAQAVRLAPNVREALGPYPAGLGRPATVVLRLATDTTLVPVLRHLGLPAASQPRAGDAVAAVLTDPERLAALLADVAPDEREILDRLAAGPPYGTVRNVRPSDESPAGRLMLRGLLVAIDSQRVELPREVGQALRVAAGVDATGRSLEPPTVSLVEREPGELDLLATTAVREFLRLVESLSAVWTAQAPPVLRAGGVGVRELRRTAKELDVDEPTAALVVEVANAAGLVNATTGLEPVYLPAPEFDQWTRRDAAARWITLATAWLAMTRQPSLVNQRGERERVINVLGPDVERGTIPALRRHILDTLTRLPPGSAPGERTDVLALLSWYAPRRASGQRPLAEAVLAEADLLGVTGAGGVTGWTRTLLAGAGGPVVAPGSAAAAEHALDHALPAAVDHFLVQPDLTVVVPGPPDRTIAAELALVADLESTGGASVYRITERSVRRALDAGRSAPELARFIAQRSRTPVPQALDYLFEDAARRHGVLRAGVAGSYLRCDDEALLARVLADRAGVGLGLRLLAPTVLVAEAPIAKVLDVLREAGYAPAAESPAGDLVTLTVDPPRSPSKAPVRVVSTRGLDTEAQLGEVVRRMRVGDEAAVRGARLHPLTAQLPGVTSAATMELLRKAVREGRPVLLGYAEPDGTSAVHTLRPISLAAGAVRGYEDGRPTLSSYPVHRITSLRLLDDDELTES